MKKYLVPVLVLLAILIGSVVFMISIGYEKIHYANTFSTNISDVFEEGGYLYAEYMGQTTQVVGQNIYVIKSALSVYDRKKIFRKPDYDEDTAIYLSFSDGAEIIIAVDDSVEDGAFVNYKYKGENLWLSIKKYKTVERIADAISPEGTYTENIIVE